MPAWWEKLMKASCLYDAKCIYEASMANMARVNLEVDMQGDRRGLYNHAKQCGMLTCVCVCMLDVCSITFGHYTRELCVRSAVRRTHSSQAVAACFWHVQGQLRYVTRLLP